MPAFALLRRASAALLVGALALLLSAVSCTVMNAPEDVLPGPGGGGSGAATGGGGESCSPEDCPGVDTTCNYRICEPSGQCGFLDAPANTPCNENGGQVCDGEGECVECTRTEHCTGDDVCTSNQCAPATCTDQQLNGTETDVDCGGDCPPCENGLECLVASDCQSRFCNSSGVCAACTGDDDCAALVDTYCDNGVCTDQLVDGSVCTADNQCLSGFCPTDDGVCCDTACNGECEACLGAKTGDANGTCAFVSADTDPDDECPGPENCDGAGACFRPRSCAEILAFDPSATDGNYTIDPDGSGPAPSMQVYCDMTYNGGGWTNLDFAQGDVLLENGIFVDCQGGMTGDATSFTCNTPYFNGNTGEPLYHYMCNGTDNSADYILDHMGPLLGHQASMTLGFSSLAQQHTTATSTGDQEFCYISGQVVHYADPLCAPYNSQGNGNCIPGYFTLTL